MNTDKAIEVVESVDDTLELTEHEREIENSYILSYPHTLVMCLDAHVQ